MAAISGYNSGALLVALRHGRHGPRSALLAQVMPPKKGAKAKDRQGKCEKCWTLADCWLNLVGDE